MSSPKIEHIIIKYLTNEADVSDLDLLSEWIKNPDNEHKFDAFVKTHYETLVVMNEPDVESIKKDLHKKMKKHKSFFNNNVSQFLKYAAIIIVFFSLGYLFQKPENSTNNNVVLENELSLEEELITIQLDNGEIKTISEDATKNITNANGTIVGTHTGNLLEYKKDIPEEKLAYNTLKVPYGKRFQVVLSDGTKVYLNAGTSLKYPIKFLDGLSREVFLDGEAFFDVTKDTKHPFLVNASTINVKVLGTKFNMSSYPEDDIINTALVEGAVEVYETNLNVDSQHPAILKPGYKASWNKTNNSITIGKANLEQHTAWMNGRLVLEEVTFKNIQKKLERQYNVTIINNNEALDERRFTARFDEENIDDVMKSLSISASFTYTVENNQIIIN